MTHFFTLFKGRPIIDGHPQSTEITIMHRELTRTLKAVALGLFLGACFSVVTAVLEREAFIPISAVVVVSITAAMLIASGFLALIRERRALAKSVLIVALLLFASFYTAMILMDR